MKVLITLTALLAACFTEYFLVIGTVLRTGIV